MSTCFQIQNRENSLDALFHFPVSLSFSPLRVRSNEAFGMCRVLGKELDLFHHELSLFFPSLGMPVLNFLVDFTFVLDRNSSSLFGLRCKYGQSHLVLKTVDTRMIINLFER